MITTLGIATATIGPADLVNVLLAPFATLAGGMAFFSGLLAARSLSYGEPAEDLAVAVDRGAAIGFIVATPLALAALAAELSSLHG